MMARLLTEEPPGPEVMADLTKTPPRRLSFKTRQAATRNYRATKVSLTSSNVALIVSKFNPIIVDDGPQGRALLRKLSTKQRKDIKARGEGMVKAAIEIFEHHDSDRSGNVKIPLRKVNDSRTKLVMVRKSSSRSSVKLEDVPSEQHLTVNGTEENEKDITKITIEGEENSSSLKSNNEAFKEVKRKPSLKAKPILKQKVVMKREPVNSLNQRIAKFNSIDASTNSQEKTSAEIIDKPNFSLNERIAQFNKIEEGKVLDSKKNNSMKPINIILGTSKTYHTADEKENRHEGIKSILRNGKNNKNPAFVSQTNERIVNTIPNSTIQNHINSSSITNSSKNSNSRSEDKELKVFEGMPDIIISAAQSINEGTENRLPVSKNNDVLINSLVSNSQNVSGITAVSKEGRGPLKPAIKSYSSDSTKSLVTASDPSEKIQLDKIKPNNSFLWKPASKLSLTEIPIYDDRPISRKSGNIINDTVDWEICKTESSPLSDPPTKDNSSMNLEVASSFIQEMNEHIDSQFGNGTGDETEELSSQKSAEIQDRNTLPKNSSFLHGKSQQDLSVIDGNGKNEGGQTNKPDLVEPAKVPPPIGKKPIKIVEDIPPQLPQKRPKIMENLGEPINDIPPPIPPSHTKPVVKPASSEDAWLSNAIKILEIPPPLRKRNDEERNSTLEQKKTPMVGNMDKRFSVSQMELIKRMSEMNLNKRNSCPYDSFSNGNNYIVPETDGDGDDHYTTIRNYNKKEVEDHDEYESIGENNYAEIEEVGSNIYDDVVSADPDHYEAIGCGPAPSPTTNSDSSCDRTNSLYGITRTASGATGPYQTTGGSDTSDEWVDIDNSDDHQEYLIVRERETSRPAADSWNMKVRRQWSRQTHQPIDGSEESLPRSEGVDTTTYDDFDDSFSDSSFESESVTLNDSVDVGVEALALDEKRPQLTEGIYGLMKQAGQRMRKHWPSLSRMAKKKSTTSLQSNGSFGRRGWSFKSKEKPTLTQSTFYLHDANGATLPRTNSQPETKVDPRRLSTTSPPVARPTSPPPPPPPPRNTGSDDGRRRRSDHNSSNSSADNESYVEGQRRLSRNGQGNSLWYVETSTDTASEHGSSQGSDLNLRFDEPLYQFYTANLVERELAEEDFDGYEEISPVQTLRPSALDLVATAHRPTLWCEVPQVRNCAILDTLTQAQKRLQEVKFEVMTSEASYFKSLTVLDKLFSSCPLFSADNILPRDDRKVLFGSVSLVRKCSERLLSALQSCWHESILLQGICDVVHEHVCTHRHVYIQYCSGQIAMDRTLKRLKHNNSEFATVLSQLETDPQCQSLTLYSFLMLPMQRITRLRLLFETILSLLDTTDGEYTTCQRTLHTLNKCVAECNEGARSQERQEEMLRLSRQLEFPPEMSLPILGDGSGRDRWLVRSGQVTVVNLDAKQTFSRRLSRSGPKLTLFLFTDLLLLTKKKSEESYLVTDHCQRGLVDTRDITDLPGHRHMLQLTLLENASGKTDEMTVSCESETERQRWLQALSPPQSDAPGETLYEGWDCPQVTVTHPHLPSQPDELALALGDVINVLRKTEGWFYGERTRDGEKGWFPGSYTREIASKHVRARNLKQRYRVLQLSADFVQQQRKIKT